MAATGGVVQVVVGMVLMLLLKLQPFLRDRMEVEVEVGGGHLLPVPVRQLHRLKTGDAGGDVPDPLGLPIRRWTKSLAASSRIPDSSRRGSVISEMPSVLLL